MKILVDNSTPDFGRALPGGVPINTQSAQTSVLVKDGSTTVIGGIYQGQETISRAEHAVPVADPRPGAAVQEQVHAESQQRAPDLHHAQDRPLGRGKRNHDPHTRSKKITSRAALLTAAVAIAGCSANYSTANSSTVLLLLAAINGGTPLKSDVLTGRGHLQRFGRGRDRGSLQEPEHRYRAPDPERRDHRAVRGQVPPIRRARGGGAGCALLDLRQRDRRVTTSRPAARIP